MRFWIKTFLSVALCLSMVSCRSLKRDAESFSIAVSEIQSTTDSRDITSQAVKILLNIGESILLDAADGYFVSKCNALVIVTNSMPSRLNYNVTVQRKEGSRICSELTFSITSRNPNSSDQYYLCVQPQQFIMDKPQTRAFDNPLSKNFWRNVDVEYLIRLSFPDSRYEKGLSCFEYELSLPNVKRNSQIDLREKKLGEKFPSIVGFYTSRYLIVSVYVKEHLRIYKKIRGDK